MNNLGEIHLLVLLVILKYVNKQVTPFPTSSTHLGNPIVVYIETKLEITWKLIIDVMLSARAVV